MPRPATRLDPIELELFRHLFTSLAEEMGIVLRKTSYSANIKERRDYSCALYNASGDAIAMGDHMPVHLGAMPASLAAARAKPRAAPTMKKPTSASPAYAPPSIDPVSLPNPLERLD